MPLLRVTTMLGGIQFLHLVREAPAARWRSVAEEFAACLVNTWEGARHLPDYVLEYRLAQQDRASRTAPPR
jgi:hypothetical protein